MGGLHRVAGGYMKSTKKHRHLRTARVLAALLAGGCALVVGGPPAQAATLGIISGTVSAAGQPVPAGSVQVVFVKYNKSGGCLTRPATNNLHSTTVNASGSYSMSLDTAYNYKIFFKPLTTAPRTAVFRWYTASSSAGTTMGYHATDPSAATCITTLTTAGLTNHNLSTNGTSIQVTGTLSTSSGTPTSNASLAITPTTTCYLREPTGYVSSPNEQGFWEMAGVDTNQTGRYIQIMSPRGSCADTYAGYYVKKLGNGFSVIPSSEVGTCGADCRFDLATSDLTGLNLRLPVTGLISGTISGPNGPVEEGSVCAVAYRDGGTSMSMTFAGSSCTNSSGQYSLDLVYDSYRLAFERQPGSPYISEWHSDVPWSSGYTASTVVCVKTSGDQCSGTKTVNATLAAGHSISGRLTDADGNGVVGASVSAMQQNSDFGWWNSVGYATTNQNGDYTVTGLPTGTYTVMSSNPDHGQVWLGGTRETATSFAVSGNVSGKNLSFPRGYTASGQITLAEGTDARVCVSAYFVGNNEFGWGDHAGGQCFTAPGGWQLKGLKAGNYRFRFDTQTGNLRSTFLGGTDVLQATVLPITSSNLTNVDIQIPNGKSLTGKVSNGEVGTPNVCVTAFKVADNVWSWGTWSGSACTGTNGEYTIRGLEAGTYRLRVQPPSTSDAAPGFYSTSGTPVRQITQASQIVIGDGDTAVSAATQTLQSTPIFTATVVDSGTAVSGVCVDAIKKNDEYSWGEYMTTSCTGNDGKVSLKGLDAGNYRFRVNPQSGNYQQGWHRENTTTTTDMSLATVKTLALENVALGNISLVSGKKVTGRITDGTNPVQGACVGALKDDGTSWGQWSGSGCTNLKGEFTVRGLDPSASYWFRVDVWSGDFRPGFVAADGTIAATTGAIASRSASADIALGDITLATAPSIKGTVTSGASTKEPNVCLSAVDATTLQWVTSTCSSPSGTFALRGLTAGSSYKINWWTPNPLLMSGWYKQMANGATATDGASDATSVEVTASGVSGLVVRLANGGTISGSLTTDLCVAAWLHPATDSASRTDATAVACAVDNKYELKGLKPATDYYLQVFKKDGTSVTQTSPTVNEAVRTATGDVNITAS